MVCGATALNTGLSSSRFNVDLPTTAAQSSRRLSNTPRHRIVPHVVVVVEIFVTERNSNHALPNPGRNTVCSIKSARGIARIVCKSIHQTNGPICRAALQRPTNQSGVERGFHSAAFHSFGTKLFSA